MKFGVVRDQNLLHGHFQQYPQSVQVIHGGQALALLPFVDGLRLLKAEVGLDVPDGQPPLLAQPEDVGSGGCQVDDRKGRTNA